MKLVQISPKIIAIEAQTSEELGRVMVRIQSHYDSPQFKGKVFTLSEFANWYMWKHKEVTFTFFNDWAGFNVPGYALRRFWNKFKDLRAEEKWLKSELEKINPKGKFYLIAYRVDDTRVRRHEVAHALYYTNKKYKQEMLAAINSVDRCPIIMQHLEQTEYHKDVIDDEYHAWVLADNRILKASNMWSPQLDILLPIMEDIYRRYKGEEYAKGKQ